MQSSPAPLFGMFLPQQCQCADALNDFVFLPVIRCGVTNFWTSCRWKFTGCFWPRRHVVETARKHFRQSDVCADAN